MEPGRKHTEVEVALISPVLGFGLIKFLQYSVPNFFQKAFNFHFYSSNMPFGPSL